MSLDPTAVCRCCGEPFTKDNPMTEWEWCRKCADAETQEK